MIKQAGDYYEYAFWLTFHEGGDVKLTRGKPTVDRSERAVQAVARLPKSLFKQAELRMVLTVPANSVEPVNVDMEVAAEALRGAIGMDFDIKVASSDA